MAKFLIVVDQSRHLVTLPYSKANIKAAMKKLRIKKHWFHKDHCDIPLYMLPTIYLKADRIARPRDIVNIIQGKPHAVRP